MKFLRSICFIPLIPLFILILFLIVAVISMKLFSDPNTIILTKKNLVNFRDVVTEESVDKAIKDIKALKKNDPDAVIYLVIESPGGSIQAGYRFENFLSKQKNIHTVTIFAASMASAIVESNPGKRYIIKEGVMMFHRGIGVPTVNDLLRFELENSKRIGISITEYRNNVLREWWLKSGEESVKAGVSDKIIKLECDEDLYTEKEKIKIMFFGKKVGDLEISKCPLVVQPIWQ